MLVSNLGAGLGAVHDGVAAIHREGVAQLLKTLLGKLVLENGESKYKDILYDRDLKTDNMIKKGCTRT